MATTPAPDAVALDAHASDPVRLGWMQGSPPPPDKQIRFADGSSARWPQRRWALSHMREFVPTANVWRGEGPISVLPAAPARDEAALDALRLTTTDGEPITWAQSLLATYTDGIVVLHRGRIVYERYFGELKAHLPHAAYSVTKSFVGLLAAMLAHRGELDPAARVPHYLPELADSAYADARVREVMDMTVGVSYSEAYDDPAADIWRYARAGGMNPRPAGYDGPDTFYDFLPTLRKEGAHGEVFAYKTVNTEVLAWILKRISGQRLSDHLSDQVWSRLGCENDAYFGVDPVGVEFGGGGLSTCLRDLARFGEMMRCEGHYNGQAIVAPAVIAGIRSGGQKAHFAASAYTHLKGWTYSDKWWVSNNAHGAYEARGIGGQKVLIDPAAEMVIARYASHPRMPNTLIDPVSLPAMHAMACALRG